MRSDHRSDLFGAGVVLYELLDRRETRSPASVESITYKICHENPRPPSEVSSLALPASIDALVATALAKDPAQRFQNARAFSHALREAIGASGEGGTSIDATVINLAQVQLQPPVQAWDDTVITTVERRFAHFVGPMSKMLVRRAAAQTHDLAELYSLLATHIGDPRSRQQFMDERAKEIPAAPAGTSGSAAASARPGTAAHTARRTAAGEKYSRTAGSASASASPRLEQPFVDETTSRLVTYLGPIAKVVARKAAQQAHTQQEFVQIVASHIGTQDRLAFLREVGFTE